MVGCEFLKRKIACCVDIIRKNIIDIQLALSLTVITGLAAYFGTLRIDSAIIPYDVWFGSDIPRIIANMSEKLSNHYRTKVHPLFSLIACLPVYIFKTSLGLWGLTVIKLAIAVVAIMWTNVIFITLRVLGCQRFDAIIFTVLAGISAAAVFWFAVPETYGFSSLSIIFGLCFAALAEHRKFSEKYFIVINAITLSMTTTNWMVGILVTITRHHWKRALQIIVNGFCLVVILWTIQKYLFPSAIFFLGDREEERYITTSLSIKSIQQVFQSFFYHTMVMPAIQEVHLQDGWPWMLTQNSLPGSASQMGIIAVLIWTGLLGLGFWTLFHLNKYLKLRIVLGATILGQLTLHFLYGSETFLYSLHFAPLLVILTALSTLTPARPLALFLAMGLILTAGYNNAIQFNKASDFVERYRSQRSQVLYQMRNRPSDPWPRGEGHVVLALPGSRATDKAYHEPGGSFSPSVSSFGVSIWQINEHGDPEMTSDRIPLSEVQQQFSWSLEQNIPGILTKTKQYEAYWTSLGPKNWALNFKSLAGTNTKPIAVIRSVGPAGGPIFSISWNGKYLLINKRWKITIQPNPAKINLGTENTKNWMTERSSIEQVDDTEGWCYARIEPTNVNDFSLIINDTATASSTIGQEITSRTSTRSTLELDLPDKRFAASLYAQVAHLIMGLVGKETRPGEPTFYPFAWQRDGAYQVVALARSGQLQIAKELSNHIAENDFFGGFGSEADAPGLSIWALENVAVRLNQSEFDQWLWPHIYRKAEFISKMLTANQPIRQKTTGQVDSEYEHNPQINLVSQPAKNGLIMGRMDWGRPLLFVNAVSYRGLLDAASLAERVGHIEDAKRWRLTAEVLKQAWEAFHKLAESNNDRSYIASLWPTWIAASQKELLHSYLQHRWIKKHDTQGNFLQSPPWTYFDVAETHQWLLLDKPENVLKTLQWFWQHQASPGLYTWWEGNEKLLANWENIRGSVTPSLMAPHYWTAAEMLLLQLDMLAYIDESEAEPTLVVGAGIPQEWLGQTMSVKGLSLPIGQVDWRWDGKQMNVILRGAKYKVRLGSVFPANTPLQIL